MAAPRKKYAGLPDLDELEPEYFGTPGLSDDESTIQTGPVQPLSPAPSDSTGGSGNDDIDRTKADRKQARQRFRGSRLTAQNVDFSDSIAGNRKSYIGLRRRVRQRLKMKDAEASDDSFEEDEGVAQRLARLRREAEELKLELDRQKEMGIDEKTKGEGQSNGETKQDDLEDTLAPPQRKHIFHNNLPRSL
ncbi:MAG: hypothetical protein Q9227_002444 [Pyrenula ochraceoflavens]